jgi:hypothetical protein
MSFLDWQSFLADIEDLSQLKDDTWQIHRHARMVWRLCVCVFFSFVCLFGIHVLIFVCLSVCVDLCVA